MKKETDKETKPPALAELGAQMWEIQLQHLCERPLSDPISADCLAQIAAELTVPHVTVLAMNAREAILDDLLAEETGDGSSS